MELVSPDGGTVVAAKMGDVYVWDGTVLTVHSADEFNQRFAAK
jgi:hypothetical protein